MMRRLLEMRFPVEKVQPVDDFGGDDDASMAANNTSAFNCRRIEGRPGSWSEHAFGRAIDINPIENPQVTASGKVSPPAGERFKDRSAAGRGMIDANGPVVKAFEGIGWKWGGNWSGLKDYQHFSSTGR